MTLLLEIIFLIYGIQGKQWHFEPGSGASPKLNSNWLVQRIIRNYYEQLWANKFDNPDKMNKFMDTKPYQG